ncbi:thiopeptide-type bacteriocin biosynthesis protein [Nocardia arthritidis]|nr:thiopeptide-type bacteriocin biosynthesis protein [Nocardia arthritidis]
MTTDQVWRSLHVHRYSGQDEFLVDGLAPVLAGLRSSGGISQSFFLRYWQGGHHVRVRFRVAAADADAVTAEAATKLAAYLAEFPDSTSFDVDEFRAAQPTMAALENEDVAEVQPPDTVRYAEYTPEYEKYGGRRGVALAEEYFTSSSDIVLAALATISGDSAKRLGIGFSTMLRGMCAAGLSTAEMAEFFRHYCLLWSPYTFEQFLGVWPQLLQQRRCALATHVAAVLAAPERLDDDPFHRAIGTAWRGLDDDIRAAIELAGPAATRARREQVLLAAFLHTHNNRLGLIPEHESFLGFLGHHVLSEVAGVTAEPELLRAVREHRASRLSN